MKKKIVTITVLQLIAELGKFPLESPVLLASEEDGSAFSGINKLELDESGGVIFWPASSTTDVD